jgi:hypothetical protein
MTTIFVEGASDRELISRLLRDVAEVGAFRVVAANGRDAARPLARKQLLISRSPVALVTDSDTTDRGRIEEQQEDLEDYLRWVSQGVPFAVIQFVPQIEAVFFRCPRILERISGERLDANALAAAVCAPAAVLQNLFGHRADLIAAILPHLTEEDVAALRTHGSVRKLRQFVRNSAVEPVPNP